jgi:uncharacterized circularly permuted ATP-grasp superfamily protein
MGDGELEHKQLLASQTFLRQGVTFTVYNDNQAPNASFRSTCSRASFLGMSGSTWKKVWCNASRRSINFCAMFTTNSKS